MGVLKKVIKFGFASLIVTYLADAIHKMGNKNNPAFNIRLKVYGDGTCMSSGTLASAVLIRLTHWLKLQARISPLKQGHRVY